MTDFNSFSKGDIIYYIRRNVLGNKEVKRLIVTTIYPKVLIAVEEKGMSQCIDIKDAGNIYFNEKDAKESEICE